MNHFINSVRFAVLRSLAEAAWNAMPVRWHVANSGLSGSLLTLSQAPELPKPAERIHAGEGAY